MGSIRAWWHAITGKPPKVPAARAEPPKPKPAPPGELDLAEPVKPKPPGNIGAGGFDPYSSDAGYAKPHSWERVDHD